MATRKKTSKIKRTRSENEVGEQSSESSEAWELFDILGRSKAQLDQQEATREMRRLRQQMERSSESSKAEPRNPEFTIARRVLAIRYLLIRAGIDLANVQQKDIIDFAEFLTGNNRDGIKDYVEEVNAKLSKNTKSQVRKATLKNLEFIKPYFQRLGLTEVVGLIVQDEA